MILVLKYPSSGCCTGKASFTALWYLKRDGPSSYWHLHRDKYLSTIQVVPLFCTSSSYHYRYLPFSCLSLTIWASLAAAIMFLWNSHFLRSNANLPLKQMPKCSNIVFVFFSFFFFGISGKWNSVVVCFNEGMWGSVIIGLALCLKSSQRHQ